MPKLANGILCFGPSFFVCAAFILSQIASKRCNYLRIDDDNKWRTQSPYLDTIGPWCYTTTYSDTLWGWPEVETGSSIKQAQAFSITTTVLGFLAWLFYLFAGCRPCSPGTFMIVGLLLLVNCIIEGCTFLLQRSAVLCDGPDLGCTRFVGMNCGIAACVLWFVSSLMTCGLGRQVMEQGASEEDVREAPKGDDQKDGVEKPVDNEA